MPQLIAAKGAYLIAASQRIAEAGAGLLVPDQESAEDIAKACLDLLSNQDYRDRARELAGENATQPTAAELVGRLEAVA